MVNRSSLRLRWWVAAVVAASYCVGLPARSQESDARIPAATGTTLAGTAVSLPDALKGKAGVLVVGFSHASGGQVSAWGKRLAADFGQSADVAYFELPMLAGAPKMLRGMIVKSMGKSVPEAERPHFLPLMKDEAAWRAVAHYDKPDDAYVLVVDGTGTVRWQTEGIATDAAYGELKENLKSLTAQGSNP
jgi:ATP10 protein